MDGEHVLCATIVLVMAYIAFPATTPTTVAMRAGLGLLQAMGERGNSHLTSRYDLLRNMYLGAVTNPGLSEHTILDFSSAMVLSTPSVADHPVFSVDLNSVGISTPSTTQNWSSVSNVGGESLGFPTLNNAVLDEVFYDENPSIGLDLGVWEDGFANPLVDPGLDFLQWSQMGTEGMQPGRTQHKEYPK